MEISECAKKTYWLGRYIQEMIDWLDAGYKDVFKQRISGSVLEDLEVACNVDLREEIEDFNAIPRLIEKDEYEVAKRIFYSVVDRLTGLFEEEPSGEIRISEVWTAEPPALKKMFR